MIKARTHYEHMNLGFSEIVVCVQRLQMLISTSYINAIFTYDGSYSPLTGICLGIHAKDYINFDSKQLKEYDE
jgi:hypothetical protein